MNPGLTVASGVAFGVAAVFAVGDWISRAHVGAPPESGWRRLEFVCKPGALAALIVAAATLHPAHGGGARRDWFVAALVFSLVGDVLLMLPREQFVGGLCAFLVGHCCYIAGFWIHGPDRPAGGSLLIGVIVAAVAVGAVGTRILIAVHRRDRALTGPVGTYMVVIAFMLASALAVGNVAAGAGAALFVASDSMIAWDRFVRKIPGGAVLIMVTYHLGQAALTGSLLR